MQRVRRPVPNTGMAFSSSDYYVGELFAHAQSCHWLLGYSDLGTSLLAGKDPHGDGAAFVLGVTYEEWVENKKLPKFKLMRQAQKPFSFGKPAAMGDVKIVLTNRRSGPDTPCESGPHWVYDGDKRVRGYKGTRFCILVDGAKSCGDVKVTRWGRRGREQEIAPTCAQCLDVSVRMSTAWLAKNRENRPYSDLMSRFVEDGMVIEQAALDRWPHLQEVFEPGTQLDPGQVMQHVSGRIRGGLEYSACSNTFFQALVGEFTKAAFWRVSMECYDKTIRVPEFAHPNSRRSRYAGGPSPLLGSRMIGFFHDELFGEHPLSVASDSTKRVVEVMEEEAMHYMPDMASTVRAEGCLQVGGWFKNAEPNWLRGGAKAADENDILIPWVPSTPRVVARA